MRRNVDFAMTLLSPKPTTNPPTYHNITSDVWQDIAAKPLWIGHLCCDVDLVLSKYQPPHCADAMRSHQDISRSLHAGSSQSQQLNLQRHTSWSSIPFENNQRVYDWLSCNVSKIRQLTSLTRLLLGIHIVTRQTARFHDNRNNITRTYSLRYVLHLPSGLAIGNLCQEPVNLLPCSFLCCDIINAL